MSVGLKGGAISKFFGGRMLVKQVKADASDLSVADTYKDLSYAAEGTIKVGSELEPVINEAGKVIDALEDVQNNTIEGIFHQSDKDIIQFLSKDCRSKYYAVYVYLGIVNDNHQEFFAPRCKIQPMVDLKSGTRKPPFKIFILDNAAAVTMAATGLPSIKHVTADVTIAINEGYKIEETAVA